VKVFRLHFEDNGQDFLYWDVCIHTLKVVDCQPFQFSVWSGSVIRNLPNLMVGHDNRVMFTPKDDSDVYRLNHLVLKITAEELEGA